MPTLPEALAERMIRLLPYQVFALVLAKLQHLAKPLGFVMPIITGVIGFGVGGAFYGRVAWQSRRTRPVLALTTAIITWLALTYAFLPFIESGILGVPLTTVVTSPKVPMGLASVAYAIVLVLLAGAPALGSLLRNDARETTTSWSSRSPPRYQPTRMPRPTRTAPSGARRTAPPLR
jgi:hypothetical protein